jgi:hypothetical protein
MTDVIFWIGATVVGWMGLGLLTAMIALGLELVLVCWTWCRATLAWEQRASTHGRPALTR